MLYTNLKHIETAAEYARIINENENMMLICGRMGPLCIPVYRIAEELEETYPYIRFYDMEYDNPESYFIHYLPEVQGLQEHPFVIFYKNSKIIKVTAGLQTKTQITTILDKEFADNLKPKSNSAIVK